MKNWNVHLSNYAESDLHEIYKYIAGKLHEPVIAGNLILRIESKVSKLNASPQSYAIYPKEPWRSRGLRRVNIGKYAIFFIPKEANHSVVVIRIIYGGRDIDRLLEETPSDSEYE